LYFFRSAPAVTDEDAMLQKALAMSMETDDVNLEAMTEEEQIQYAMKMSMADQTKEVKRQDYSQSEFFSYQRISS